MSQEKVEGCIKLIVEELKKHKPRRIILFGSRAKGCHKKRSDIDIAVDMELTFREKRKLREKVDEVSGLYSVDLVFLDDVEDDFKARILREGVILYEKK
ncbi:nucleotidyltransferase [Thermosulfidibacter takaii ABI70S6]|uniref:Nucleotidyltransferase n=1 Tax=Thermosulfidibacter takaii (strain DSM 17441 / JCM 13301 / NBRC 103674 / ABI70S6) TaxID=1298851 RepID=A0A0S3QRV8_THET7|nr:nucleotidyltransferase domain-containing protein [Thermosulfidibacter takaii]BAT71061.1 nucleotidyltransferase [Thermosulfidibacter takaii ABI70S6]